MKRKYYILTLCLIISVLFSGCMNQQRRTTPPGGQQGQMMPNISATYEKADIGYATLTSDVTARAGTSSNAPAVYTLTNGTTVKVLAKYDGYYVALLPNNQIGFIPVTNTTPSQAGGAAGTPGTTGTPGTPRVTQPAPSIPNVPGPTGSSLASEESTMISLVNSARSQAGLSPLGANLQVTKLARLKASDIASKNYFNHTSPTYGSPFDMMKNYGVSYMYAGENLAKNSNAQAAEQALMNSPGHKANILNANFTEIGIGVVQIDATTKVYVQMFIGK